MAIRQTVIGVAALAIAVAAVATSGRAETAGPSNQTSTYTTLPTTSRGERPRGAVFHCSSGGGGLSEFRKKRWNLVVGPLAMTGARVIPAAYSTSFRGNKFPVYVKRGHHVTVALAREAGPDAGLAYLPVPPRPVTGYGYRVITFIACRRGETGPDTRATSFWAGGVKAGSPRCVPLLIWVDDAPTPHRAVIHLGVRDCA